MNHFGRALVGVAFAAGTTPTFAAVIFTFAQQGNDVVLTGGGTLILGADSGYVGTEAQTDFVDPEHGAFAVGTPAPARTYRLSGSGNASFFGTGGLVAGTSGTGDSIGIQNFRNAGAFYIKLPSDYDVSNSRALNGTATFANQTFASLGLTAGTYIYTLRSSDTVTLVVPTYSQAPEPAAWTMMIAGFGAIGAALRRRRNPAISFTWSGSRRRTSLG